MPDKGVERDFSFATLDLCPGHSFARLNQNSVERIPGSAFRKGRHTQFFRNHQTLSFELFDLCAQAHFGVANHLEAFRGPVDLFGLGGFQKRIGDRVDDGVEVSRVRRLHPDAHHIGVKDRPDVN